MITTSPTTGHSSTDSMNILVTGGFGYLGSHISDYFVHKGHKVRILSRSPHTELIPWRDQFDIVIGDVADYLSIENCCQGIDTVIHTAALNEVECRTDPPKALSINGLGTKNLLDDSYNNHVEKFIYLSTFHVYGPPKTEVITENTHPNPINDYSSTHYIAEKYCHQFETEKAFRSYILRISNGYGPPLFKSINRWTLVLNELCSVAYKKNMIVLKSKGTQERDFIGINDILQGIELFVENNISVDDNNIYNLGSGQNISIISLANAVAKVYRDRYNKNIAIEVPQNAIEPDIQISFKYSIDKIEKLGYHPTSILVDEIHKIFQLLEN